MSAFPVKDYSPDCLAEVLFGIAIILFKSCDKTVENSDELNLFRTVCS